MSALKKSTMVEIVAITWIVIMFFEENNITLSVLPHYSNDILCKYSLRAKFIDGLIKGSDIHRIWLYFIYLI